MSIEYDNQFEEGTIYCDECEDQIDEQGTFQDVVNAAKAKNWKIFYDEDLKRWCHYCYHCKTSFNN